MKILVYGAGVIGGYMAHLLCTTENQITVLARGEQRAILEREGLVCASHFLHIRTVDRPAVIGALAPDDRYDVIFVVMRYEQMSAVLPVLADNVSPLVVLVGNNMSAPAMEAYLHAHSPAPKTVAFGFQATGGARREGRYIYVAFGRPALNVGSAAPEADWKAAILSAFRGANYGVHTHGDMDAWYKSHLALILPICYVCYQCNCDLRRVSGPNLDAVIAAAREGYRFLEHIGCPVDQTDLNLFDKKRGGVKAVLWLMAKTKIGELAASNHAKHAVGEISALDEAFEALRAGSDFSMPAWDALRRETPSWEALRKSCAGGNLGV